MEESDKKQVLVIAIVIPIIVVLIIGAIIAYVVYKKIQHDKEQRGVEVVAVHKTRPSTPPEKRNKNEPAAHGNTDEEDVRSGNDNRNDLMKQKSRSEQPDVNI